LKSRLSRLEAEYRQLKPWLLFREEDSVLILPPNKVYKLGGSGAAIMGFLQKGGRLGDIPGLDEGKLADLERFFAELAAASSGEAVDLGRVPYDFAFTRLPILGELALTYGCNERCRFCYAACGDVACGDAAYAPVAPLKAGRGELSTEEARRVIRIFKEEAKIPFFSFTGGEPLLRKDLEELASYARDIGLRTNLITNGSLASPERARSLKSAGIETAQVSLESPEEAIHDGLCGREGAWKKTVAGIANLRDAGISVQTNSTLTSVNRESLLGLPAFLSTLGVKRFSMNLFIPSGRGLGNADLFVSYSEVGETVDSMRKAANLAGLTFFWYSPTPYCYYNPVARGLGNKSCAAMDGLIHVDPYGDVLPCSSWPEPVGSILEEPFKELWFSKRAAYFKEKRFAPARCQACEKFVACQGACPLYWKTVGEGELDRLLGAACAGQRAQKGVESHGTGE
jgi:radical SAM protein with 4Fe4S-binding SPASM domain